MTRITFADLANLAWIGAPDLPHIRHAATELLADFGELLTPEERFDLFCARHAYDTSTVSLKCIASLAAIESNLTRVFIDAYCPEVWVPA